MTLDVGRGFMGLLVAHDVLHVLVSAAGEVDEEYLVLPELRRALDRLGERVARFERGDDALEAAERVERGDRLVVR